MNHSACTYLGESLGLYGFGEDHPFGTDRMHAFQAEFEQQGLDQSVDVLPPKACEDDALLTFHTEAYIHKLKLLSAEGTGFLDCGDTPVFPGIYEAALTVTGTVLDAVDRLMKGEYRHAFIPIAGLHHARRDGAAGFCAVNDCGIAIEQLKARYRLQRIAYVDIDAHHGDGVFYGFEEDEQVIIVDFHEDGRSLYPGTGSVDETGKGRAKGTKLNIPLPPYAKDEIFFKLWPSAERFLHQFKPQFIILQAGADSIAGDPITHLQLTHKVHSVVTQSLMGIADQYAEGRLLALGGGGYNRWNLAKTWNAVIRVMVDAKS